MQSIQKLNRFYPLFLYYIFCFFVPLFFIIFADCVSMKLKIYFDNLEHINKNNINKVCENFVQLIKDEIENFAPLTNLSRKQKKLVKKPWITKGIWTSIKNKQRLYKTWFLEGNSYERSFYKKYNNCLTRVKKTAKILYYSSAFASSKNDPKKTWDIIRELVNHSKVKKNKHLKV